MSCTAIEECLMLLESLETSGFFSSIEIREYTRRLLRFEEMLQRKKKLHVDMVIAYVRYVQYFEHLQTVRARKAGGQAVSLFRRLILDIFRRGLERFYDSINLWALLFSYISRNGARRLISRSLVRALRMNPSSVALWAYAASWEFAKVANPFGARTLIQRGLRSCEKTRELWKEYFDMEVRYAELTQTRRRFVNSDQELLQSKVEDGRTLSIPEGNFALSVYESAKSQHAGDFHFLLNFFLVASNKPWARRLCNNIHEDLWKRFPQNRLELTLAGYGVLPSRLDRSIFHRMLNGVEILESSSTMYGCLRLLNDEHFVNAEQARSGELLPYLQCVSELSTSHHVISGRSSFQFREVLGPVLHRTPRSNSAEIINSEASIEFYMWSTAALKVNTVTSVSTECIFLVGKTHLSPHFFFT